MSQANRERVATSLATVLSISRVVPKKTASASSVGSVSRATGCKRQRRRRRRRSRAGARRRGDSRCQRLKQRSRVAFAPAATRCRDLCPAPG